MIFLVVDDDRAVCEGIARRLEQMEHPDIAEIKTAFSGEEALLCLSQEQVDVLITDIEMFEVNGLGLIAHAKALQKRLSCIIVTAHEEFAYARHAIELEVEDFLLKPISKACMRQTVEKVIARRNTQRRYLEAQLRLALERQLRDDEPWMPALFAQAGLPPAPESVCAVAWDGDTPWPEGLTLWSFPLDNHRCALVDATDPQAALKALHAFALRLGQSLGVSDSGSTLGSMARQANRRLELRWFFASPRAVFENEQAPKGYLERFQTRQALAHAYGLRPQALEESVRQLIVSEEPNAPARACALLNAVCAALSEQAQARGAHFFAPDWDALAGWEAVLTHLVDQTRLLSECKPVNGPQAQPIDPIAWACDYVRDHPAETLDMAALANRLNLSYTYFSKLFKAQTGQSFSQYAQEQRMRSAAEMLRSGKRAGEVAAAFGYLNPQNFARVFRRHWGISPGAYRKRREPSSQG